MTGWELNGVNLRTLGTEIETTDGWEVFPDSVQATSDDGFRHGQRRLGRKIYRPTPMNLTMRILPYDATTGLVVTSPEEHIQEHLDALFGALHSPTGAPVPLIKTLGAAQRQVMVSPERSFQVEEQSKTTRSVVLNLMRDRPFWRALPQQVFNNASGAVNLINVGNAPVNDMIMNFDGAGSITLGTQVVTATGAALVDLENDEITAGGLPAPGLVTWIEPWLLELQAGDNNATITGSVDITYYGAYF